MELHGRRAIVAGATGVLGGLLGRRLAEAGARVGLAGRDRERLRALGDELGAPTAALELRDPASARGCVDTLAGTLGGLDLLVVATGAVAFGAADDVGADVERTLVDVNALGPMALARAALAHLGPGGTIAAVSAVVAEHPTAGMAAYSASKAALSAYLTALRRERRRDGLVVLDVRPQHLDTGFADRALAGAPPALPEPARADDVAAAIVDALREDRRELAYDLRARALVAA
jgi:short-subunit dehydrogenase